MKSVIVLIAIASLIKAESCAKGWKLNQNTGKCFYIGLGFDLNHHQCAARCHALHARLPCIDGPQDETFFPQMYPMPQEYPPVRSAHLARTHVGADRNANYDWGEGCTSAYANWAPFYQYQPEWHCVTIQYNLQDTLWITMDCDTVTPGTRALCVCEGSVGEDLLLPAGDSVSPPPYCPNSYFVRNPGNNKCYTDRTSQAQQGTPCSNICTAWEAHRPDLQDPAIGTFLEQNFPGYNKYPSQSYANRCFCERDASYVYFPDPAPGMEQPGDVYPPLPPPFSCPAHYAMDPDSAQCMRDGSNPTDPTDDHADSTHGSREQVIGLPVVVGVVVLVVAIVVVVLLIAMVVFCTRRSSGIVSDVERLQRAFPILPTRQPRRPQQDAPSAVPATIHNPTVLI